MQNQQMPMAGMAGGPVEGTPIMGNAVRPSVTGPRESINTYIYDYFKRNGYSDIARAMLDANLNLNLQPAGKLSPNGSNVNGVEAMDAKDGLPMAALPANPVVENSFLMDWWCQFWDIYSTKRSGNGGNPRTQAYSQQAKHMAQMQNEQRLQRLAMGTNGNMTPQQFQMMQGLQRNGDPKAMQRVAMMNRNPNGANAIAMNQMKNPMMSAQMQRDGSGMNMNGPQPQSPNSNDNAGSPNKRPRVEGGMNAANMPGGQYGEFAQQGQNVSKNQLEVYAQTMFQQQGRALNNHAMSQAMNGGVQGSPMGLLEGQSDAFVGNPTRPGGMPGPGAPGQPGGNHALQDYQMQLMLLEQQNKKRLLMARQEQDNMAGGPHNQPNVGGPGFPPAMSPQGSRSGPSPGPGEMKRGTPKLPQQGLPGSPMPDAQQQRNSPAPNITFDPSQMPPGMPPQYPGFNQMQPNPQMMRPPSSHPGAFNGQMTPQQMEAMRQNGGMPNGWRGPGNPAMMQAQQQMGGPMNNVQQRGQMAPPPAPPAGEQPRAQEPSPQQTAAPPTPNTSNKAAPKKKGTKDNNKKPKAKGANTGATPAASADEPPTPSTPITPAHKQSFANGQPAQPAHQPQPAVPPQPQMDQAPFGTDINPGNDDFLSSMDGFDSNINDFDFDSFLQVNGDDGITFGTDFGFETSVEATGEL